MLIGRVRTGVVVGVIVALPASTGLGQEAPWIERAALSLDGITLAPTTAERLTAAEVLIVFDHDLVWQPLLNRWKLDVDPWEYLGGADGDLLCDPTDPFYDQPTTGAYPEGTFQRGCSGFLVGSDRVISAGHCNSADDDPGQPAPYDCLHKYVVFDFADLGPVDPGDDVYLLPEQVVPCSQVLVDTYLSDDRQLPGSPLGSGGGDWALLQLAPQGSGEVPRLPLVLERFPQTLAGDRALVLGHPARIPMKAEVTAVDSMSGNVLMHGLFGHSGSAVINLETGKVYSNLTHGNVYGWVVDQGACSDPCFECPGVSFSGTSSAFWLDEELLPPIGLQILPPAGNVVDYYGPPTSAEAFEAWATTVSAPSELPAIATEISWSVEPDGGEPALFEVVEGPSSGTLLEGESATVEMRPVEELMDQPGLYEQVVPFFDFTYGTRDPITHRAHVGVDGFTLFPDDPFDGEGLGVPHGEVRWYTPVNRWLGFQELTVRTSAPWLELNGTDGTTPIEIQLPGKYMEAPQPSVAASPDGTGINPGVYLATVTFSSNDSGFPPFEITNEVRFDHCRLKFLDLTLPWTFTLPAGGSAERTLNVPATSGTGIKDVDVVAQLTVKFNGTDRPYQVSLRSPQGTVVILKDDDDPAQTFYDDETTAPFQPLFDFDGQSAQGSWVLRIEREPGGQADLTLTLKRFEVRVHNHDQAMCA